MRSKSADKEKSTAKSPQMSLNFTLIREINRLAVSLVRKFENTRVGDASSNKASKDGSTLLRTTTTVPKNELQKDSSVVTPLAEAESAFDGCRSQKTSPIISSPFSWRTEERASSRKKKLEKEFRDSEAQKMRLHTKFKEKAEINIRKLRQSFCFKARSAPDFYKDREASRRGTKKDPESPKQGRRPLSIVHCNRPFQGKNCGTCTKPLNSNSYMITTHDNTSPNIQHGHQNDRNYK
ncbi:unnamed protein product [Sphenostylis stenocarpa]|uniref:TPX2 C-terminal domain-containing protein n=1 Tax=Sphenostylis stenocarpa TaxID=92480 RepID=A0AA86RYJ9_9FABA|nr:unnamed protein product [Sphenostylis stenocarpa]